MAEVLYGFGNASASLVAGANITLSSSGGSITIIGNTNSGATTFLAGVSTQGNTAGTTGLVNNQLLLVGGSNILLSQSANGQSATVSFLGLGAGVSTDGNTDGTTGMAGRQLVLVGGSNISLSQSLNGAFGTVTFDAGGITEFFPGGNAVGSEQMTGPVISINAGNNLTWNFVDPNEVALDGPNMLAVGVSDSGNTYGDTGVFSQQVVFVGGNGIALSGSSDAGSATFTIFDANAYASKSASYTLTPADYLVNGTTGSFTVTLPTAVGIAGKIYIVKNSGAGTMTVQGTGGETIDGLASQLVGAGSALTVMSDGANWIII
jgi:hypothetical protein